MSMIPIMPLSSWARMWQWNTVAPTTRVKCIRILTSPRGARGTILFASSLVGPAVDRHHLEVIDVDVEGCGSRALFLITHSSVFTLALPCDRPWFSTSG